MKIAKILTEISKKLTVEKNSKQVRLFESKIKTLSPLSKKKLIKLKLIKQFRNIKKLIIHSYSKKSSFYHQRIIDEMSTFDNFCSFN